MIKKKWIFVYEGDDDRINDKEENFRRKHFLLVINEFIKSMEKEFTQIKFYNDFSEFYFVLEKY